LPHDPPEKTPIALGSRRLLSFKFIRNSSIIAPQPVGQRNGLSEFDIRTINAIYPRKTTLGDQSTNGPAFAHRASQLLLGWTGVGNLRMNFMSSGDGSGFSGKVTLNDTSPSALSLSVFHGRYVVAWRGVGNNQLNTMLSTNGGNWLAKRTLTDTTTSGPTLAVVNRRLLLAWRGVANNLLNAMRSFNGSTFFSKVTLPETTLSKPSLHVDDGIAYLLLARGRKRLPQPVAQPRRSGLAR